jgi:hypothetical protein
MASPFTGGLRSGGFLALTQPSGPVADDAKGGKKRIDGDVLPTPSQARITAKSSHHADRRRIRRKSVSMSNLYGSSNGMWLLSADSTVVEVRPRSGSQQLEEEAASSLGYKEIVAGLSEATPNVWHSSNRSNSSSNRGSLNQGSTHSDWSGDMQSGISKVRFGDSQLRKYICVHISFARIRLLRILPILYFGSYRETHSFYSPWNLLLCARHGNE